MRYAAGSKDLFATGSSVLLILLLSSPGFSLPGPLPGMEFVEIPAGTFMKRCLVTESDSVIFRGTQVQVDAFEMMTTEVTQEQWQMIMGTSIYDLMGDIDPPAVGPEYPVYAVNLYDCWYFIELLNELDTVYTYRLPFRFEWEYACRAGTSTLFFWGDDSHQTINDFCWYKANSGMAPNPVGRKLSNQWGLYDMAGNVMEWCDVEPRLLFDPETGDSLRRYPVRGGSWHTGSGRCSSRSITGTEIHSRSTDTGFRLIREEIIVPYNPTEEQRLSLRSRYLCSSIGESLSRSGVGSALHSTSAGGKWYRSRTNRAQGDPVRGEVLRHPAVADGLVVDQKQISCFMHLRDVRDEVIM